MRRLFFIGTVLALFAPLFSGAQSHLDKGVNVKAKQKAVSEVLDIISKQGGFYFSYNSNIVPADSVIDIDVWNKSVRQTLDIIFKGKFEYKETPNHVIIQQPSAGQYWYVSGYITDYLTGERVRDVSVFESGQLVASMTNEQGYFKLKLKDKIPSTTISVRKSLYRDTVIEIKPGVDQEVKVSISPRNIEMEPVIINSSEQVEGTWLGKMFLSSRQRIQSMNLNKFFVDMPIQGSILPGLSSQGKMSTQVVNNFSFNMIGGYTAGVKGAEIGGVFNINKKDVGYVQAGGVFNIVGGSVGGAQLAGVHNNVLQHTVGMQAAGVSNLTRKYVKGVQAAGVYNHADSFVTGTQVAGAVNFAGDSVTGGQAAGAVNVANKNMKGIQVSGAVNIARQDMVGVQVAGAVNVAENVKGFQFSGFLNTAKYLKGVQVGVLNLADSSDGIQVGMFSFVRKGYHKISLEANETAWMNISFKTGTQHLYNIYTAGAAFSSGGDKALILGVGYGSELSVGKRLTVGPELTGGIVYLGYWAEVNPLIKLRLIANVRINKYLAFYAGPSFNMYWDNKYPKVEGYKVDLLPDNYKRATYNTNLSSWVGWNVGVTFF